MRNLATIQKVVAITPIKGADRIEMCQVLGWECVVSKEYNLRPGDLVVYFEIDSILPELEMFEFMRARHFRVKTARFKGQIAQGLALPLYMFLGMFEVGMSCKEGLDVTDILNVKKHDPEAEVESKLEHHKPKSAVFKFMMRFYLYRKVYLYFNKKEKGSWPSWISKTDEERIQNCVSILFNNQGKSFYVAEKLDGQSGSFFLHKPDVRLGFASPFFGVCSRNIWLKTPDETSYWRIAREYQLEEVMRNYRTMHPKVKDIVIQGEIIGEKIQKNRYKIQGLDFYVFNVIIDHKRLGLRDMLEFCEVSGLKHVPIIDDNWSNDTEGKTEMDVVREQVAMSMDDSKLYKRRREGIVVRMNDNPRISYKVINPEFLLEIEG